MQPVGLMDCWKEEGLLGMCPGQQHVLQEETLCAESWEQRASEENSACVLEVAFVCVYVGL